jgi:tRNA pseudouridine32 synthase/23S rRNA pseudouridine746 synthase
MHAIDAPPALAELKPLHCDEWLVALDKPGGMLCVPGRGADKQDCLASRVQRVLDDALVVHRLDQATSGLVVFGRGAASQRVLSKAFAGRQVRKTYVACVAGRMSEREGRIELPMGADWPNRPRQQVDFERGKPSLTEWRLLSYDEASDSSRLALMPHTGRSHQLRVHLMAIGHPILGDTLYAPPQIAQLASRLMLHAQSLGLPHPRDGAWLELECPAPF